MARNIMCTLCATIRPDHIFKFASYGPVFQSASPETVNNLLNLVADPVPPSHHCHQPVQSD